MADDKDQWSERIEQILQLNLKLVGADAGPMQRISDNVDQLDMIIAGLHTMAGGGDSRSTQSEEEKKRMNELVETLLKYTMMDFSQKITISDRGDDMDAIALGLNTLGEELDSHIQMLQQKETEMKKKAEELLRSNKQLEEYVYIASHDLQEPLRTISNYVGLFQQAYRDQPDHDPSLYLDFINRATVRMQLLIKNLLDYARIGQNQAVIHVDCNILATEVLKDMVASIEESQANITIGHLPVVQGRHADLKSLFQNLISNAIKYRNKDVSPAIHISATTQKDVCTFAIEDNGIGIEQKYHERIFSIFQKLHSQKEYPGTGIGLAQCKKIVEMNGGKIWVTSKHDHGSIFHFTIPLATSAVRK